MYEGRRSAASRAATTPYTSGECPSSSTAETLMELICKVLPATASTGMRPGVQCVYCMGLNNV